MSVASDGAPGGPGDAAEAPAGIPSAGRTGELDGLTAESLAAALGLDTTEIHRSLRSTSDRVRELLHDGAGFYCPVVADEQTAGRGRQGRSWASPPGAGVWVSMAVPGAPIQVDALLPLRIGLALARALDPESAWLRLKWPNDLVLDLGDGGLAKVGGILCERIAAGGGDAVIAGLGINVLEAPQMDSAQEGEGERSGRALAPGALHLVAPGLSRRSVLEAAVEAVRAARAHGESALSHAEQLEWSRRDALRGRHVQIDGGGGGITAGTVQGVDGVGRLIVETHSGPQSVAAGSVRLVCADNGAVREGRGGPGLGNTYGGSQE